MTLYSAHFNAMLELVSPRTKCIALNLYCHFRDFPQLLDLIDTAVNVAIHNLHSLYLAASWCSRRLIKLAITY